MSFLYAIAQTDWWNLVLAVVSVQWLYFNLQRAAAWKKQEEKKKLFRECAESCTNCGNPECTEHWREA